MENPADRVVVSIACRKGLTLLNLVPRNTPVTGDFGSAIWDAFQKAGVEFELVGTSRKEISLLVTEVALTEEFLDKLCGLAEVDLKGYRALVTLVGHNASENPANLARAAKQLRGIPGGAALAWCSESRFAYILDESALNSAAEALHAEFFGSLSAGSGSGSGATATAASTTGSWLGFRSAGDAALCH